MRLPATDPAPAGDRTFRVRAAVEPDATATWEHLLAWSGPSMGGRLEIHLSRRPDAVRTMDRDRPVASIGAAVARRVAAWSGRLTRFDPASELSRLNADPCHVVPIGPTLATILAWAAEVRRDTSSIVDPTLLDARLAAEGLAAPTPGTGAGWRLQRTGRTDLVSRPPGLRFDLDGIAKGWLADRALGLLSRHPGAVVDADGDIAIHVAPGDAVCIGIADPRTAGGLLATLRLTAPAPHGARYGVATSGTSVHRWSTEGSATVAHHLIDPRTRLPARTDVVQATVLARSARRAEALAKMVVILGCVEGLARVEAAGALAAIALTENGECLATSSTLGWLGPTSEA